MKGGVLTSLCSLVFINEKGTEIFVSGERKVMRAFQKAILNSPPLINLKTVLFKPSQLPCAVFLDVDTVSKLNVRKK